jgi:hypothetical protein
MYSRRKFLMRLFLFTPFLFAPFGLLNRMKQSIYAKSSEKFIKQGWLLQKGDV